MVDTILTVTQVTVSLTHEHGKVTCYHDEEEAAFPWPYSSTLRL